MSDVLSGFSRTSGRGSRAASTRLAARRTVPTDGAALHGRAAASPARGSSPRSRRGRRRRARSSPAPTARSRRFALALPARTCGRHLRRRRGGPLRRQSRVAAASQEHFGPAGPHEGLHRLRAAARLRGLARRRRGAPDRAGACRRRSSRPSPRGARERGLAVVVEAHGPAEISPRAAVDAGRPRRQRPGPRELRDGSRRARRDGAAIPPGPVRLAESGIRDRADIERLSEAGYRGVSRGRGAPARRGSRGRAAGASRMTAVKICGLTRAEDVVVACELGAAILGLQFRGVVAAADLADAARELAAAAPPGVLRVGVFAGRRTPSDRARGRGRPVSSSCSSIARLTAEDVDAFAACRSCPRCASRRAEWRFRRPTS